MARTRFRRGIRSPALTFLPPRHERAFHPGPMTKRSLSARTSNASSALREIFPAASPRRTLLPLSATRLFFALRHIIRARLLFRFAPCRAFLRLRVIAASLPVGPASACAPMLPLFPSRARTPLRKHNADCGPSFQPSARTQVLPCRRPCFRVQHRLKSFPCAFWTCSFFRQHPASAWGASLLRPPGEKPGLSLPALDIFESRLYKDFQI